MSKDCPKWKVTKAPALRGVATIVDFASIKLDCLAIHEIASSMSSAIGLGVIAFGPNPKLV